MLQETREKLSAVPEDRVEVTVPPANLAVKRNLKEEPTRLGADLDYLDGIFDGAGADQAVQQVCLQMNVKDTVGVALTEVEIPVSAPANPSATLVVDHPYVIRMLDVRRSWPLSLTVISNPEARRSGTGTI